MGCEEKMRILKGLMLYYEYKMKRWEVKKNEIFRNKTKD